MCVFSYLSCLECFLYFRSDEVVPPKLSLFLLKLCQEIAAGLAYLSAKNFIHRDLAARNILISENFTSKVDYHLFITIINCLIDS